MSSFLRNTVSKLYNAVSAPVAAKRDALAERLRSIRETASLLYNRMMENIGYGREGLKGIVKKEAEEEQQQKPAATKEEEEAKELQQEPAAAKEKNYLTDRQQRVVLDGRTSSWQNIYAGVSQGSVLGPLL